MKAREVLVDVGHLACETLEVMGKALLPWNAAEYCLRCGVPPLQIRTDWAGAAATLRRAAEPVDAAEFVSQALRLVDSVVAAVEEARSASGESGWLILDVLRPLVVNALGRALAARYEDPYSDSLPFGVPVYKVGYLLIEGLLLIDERLKESMGHTSISDRWWELFRAPEMASFWQQEVLFGVGVAALFGVMYASVQQLRASLPARLTALVTHSKPFLHIGYDAPVEPGFEETHAAAQRSLVGSFRAPHRVLAQADYLGFDEPEPMIPHGAVSFAVVPITHLPTSVAPQLTDPPLSLPWHGGGVYVQASGDVSGSLKWQSSALSWKLLADGGVLFPLSGEPALRGGATGALGAEARFTYERPPILDVENKLPNLDMTPDGFDDAANAEGVAIVMRRCVAETRATLEEFSARLDLQGVELRIGRVPVLRYLFPHGLRIVFDVGAIVSGRRDGQRDARLTGGLGGEVVIPLDIDANVTADNGTLPLFRARVSRAHVRVDARGQGAGGATPTSSGGLGVTITADVSATLFGVLTVHANGTGFALRAASSDTPGGNLAGIGNISWDTVWPSGVGIELRCWQLKGAGYLAYDAATKRISGALEVAIGSWFQLKGLGVCEPTPDGAHQSWVALATYESPKPGGLFTPKGIGVLYGSRRTSDPDAFLDGLRTGALDAIMFPKDPVGNASVYVASLERLFPIANDGQVIGVLLKVSALGSIITASLGLIFDRAVQPRTYLVAQVRLAFPSVDIKADGVAIWDAARDEFQLRIVLRNSHMFGAELTGEALMFRGDPDRDDGRDQRCTLFSVGGFHPAYTMPGAALRVPPRVALTFSKGDHLRIEWKLYLAITPGAFHCGMEALLEARFAGFGIRGRLGFDALISRDEMDISLRASIELQLGSRTLAGASFEGALSGWQPVKLVGKVCFSFLCWEWCSPRFTIFSLAGDNASPAADVAARVLAAMRDVGNWDNGGAPGVSLRPAERPGVWLSPSAPLRFAQTVVPLDRAITHVDGAVLAGAITITIEAVRSPGDHWTSSPVEGEFAPVLYFDLTPEERLAARAFDVLPAGFVLDRPLGCGPPVEAVLAYEDLTIDSSNPIPRVRATSVVDPEMVAAALTFDPHAQARTRDLGKAPLRVVRERFAILDERGTPLARDLDYTDARGRVANRGNHIVVPMAEVA